MEMGQLRLTTLTNQTQKRNVVARGRFPIYLSIELPTPDFPPEATAEIGELQAPDAPIEERV